MTPLLPFGPIVWLLAMFRKKLYCSFLVILLIDDDNDENLRFLFSGGIQPIMNGEKDSGKEKEPECPFCATQDTKPYNIRTRAGCGDGVRRYAQPCRKIISDDAA